MTESIENVAGQRHDRTALILYGSETGNSQDVAEELGRVAERIHFQTVVCEMDQVNINALLDYTIVLFAVSTTGQGEFPKNARLFWRSLLRKRLPPGCLDHVSFTTFGLGDSSYPKFNWAARKLHKRLEQLGAKEVYPRGEADEQHSEGIDGTFLSWSADLRTHLLSSYPLPEGLTPIPPDVLLPPKYTLELLRDPSDIPTAASIQQGPVTSLTSLSSTTSHATERSTSTQPQDPPRDLNGTSTSDISPQPETEPNMRTKWPLPFERETAIGPQLKGSAEGYESIRDSRLPPSDMLPLENGIETLLIKNERVTPDTHWQDVRLLTFLTNDQNLYNPGDTVTIFPKNFPEDVQTLIDLQGWNDVADIPLSFKARPPDFFNAENFVSLPRGLVPLKNSTLRQLLIHNLDFTAIPKRSFFQMIAHHTDDPMHKERLLEFANPVFTDEFYDYATRPRRSILEVLQDFPSVKLPWSWALALFPVIRGREFSICSGGTQRLYHDGNELIKFQLLIAIVKYKTVLKKIRQGLCSRYIASLHGETLLKVKMSSNAAFDRALKLNSNYPVIMVGPGTGVAPCRSLIWQRAADAFEENHTVHDAILFFGNRNANADYFFRDEWAIPSLRLQVFTAFSRDQRQKIYVQDLIRREGPRVHNLLAQNALIIVCGSSGKMPQQVREAFLDVMEEHGGPWESRQKVEETFNLMEKRGQYLQETW